jgi:hypothetical protein
MDDRPAEHEVPKVTPEMLKAGVIALEAGIDVLSDEAIAREVYIAMKLQESFVQSI